MGAYIALASLTVMLAFLAVVLSVAGVATKRLLDRVFAAKRDENLKAQSLVAAAKSRAALRAAARA